MFEQQQQQKKNKGGYNQGKRSGYYLVKILKFVFWFVLGIAITDRIVVYAFCLF